MAARLRLGCSRLCWPRQSQEGPADPQRRTWTVFNLSFYVSYSALFAVSSLCRLSNFIYRGSTRRMPKTASGNSPWLWTALRSSWQSQMLPTSAMYVKTQIAQFLYAYGKSKYKEWSNLCYIFYSLPQLKYKETFNAEKGHYIGSEDTPQLAHSREVAKIVSEVILNNSIINIQFLCLSSNTVSILCFFRNTTNWIGTSLRLQATSWTMNTSHSSEAGRAGTSLAM